MFLFQESTVTPFLFDFFHIFLAVFMNVLNSTLSFLTFYCYFIVSAIDTKQRFHI